MAAVSAGAADVPAWSVARLTGAPFRCLRGVREDRIALMACAEACAPIPWQLDERDAGGRLALTEGPEPNFDDPPGVVDDNDLLLWMAADAGRAMPVGESPADAVCGLEVHLVTPGSFSRWVYAFVFPGAAPRAARTYVRYDAERDRIISRRVAMGFGGPTPQYLAAVGAKGQPGGNLLDRLKVRASARFFGLIPMGRDEGDLRTEFVAWRAGPIRVMRRQRQWVRLGFGIRSPVFGSDTSFYRNYAELPVHLRLNFPPTYFFRHIEVRAVLDFRDLRGWKVVAEGMERPATVGSLTEADRRRLAGSLGDWFALIGPDAMLVSVLRTSPSLATVKRRIVYRETSGDESPEAVPGENPGIGYRLTDWGEVSGGAHWFSSLNYALPPDTDLRTFLRERAEPVRIATRPWPPSP